MILIPWSVIISSEHKQPPSSKTDLSAIYKVTGILMSLQLHPGCTEAHV